MNWKIQKFETCESTNTKLKQALLEGKVKVGAVFMTLEQTKGRGRLDRSWISPQGNLAMSVACPLPQNPQEVYQLNLIAAWSVLCLLKNKYSFEDLFLKWPNDVWIGDKKICGILSESFSEKKVAIVGIGINVNSRLQDFPKNLQPSLTTLREVSGSEFDFSQFVKNFLEIFQNDLEHYAQAGLAFFLPEMKTHLKYFGQKVQVESSGTTFEGEVLGIDENGFLKIQTRAGARQVLAGDITLSEEICYL